MEFLVRDVVARARVNVSEIAGILPQYSITGYSAMPRIFDNIDQKLLDTLRPTLQQSQRADFCIGYFNLRGWQTIDDIVQAWQPEQGQVCRVIVGMQRPPHEDIRELYRQADESGLIDNATASRLKTQFAAHLREQITLVYPPGKTSSACVG